MRLSRAEASHAYATFTFNWPRGINAYRTRKRRNRKRHPSDTPSGQTLEPATNCLKIDFFMVLFFKRVRNAVIQGHHLTWPYNKIIWAFLHVDYLGYFPVVGSPGGWETVAPVDGGYRLPVVLHDLSLPLWTHPTCPGQLARQEHTHTWSINIVSIRCVVNSFC